jgi:PAS domain S-box-containing protein
MSEQKYHLLFENMTSGFALHEMIYDEQGKPLDYCFIEINPAFEKLTGLSSEAVLGKTIKEILPNFDQYWIDTYGKVVETGVPIAHQNYFHDLQKYFDVWAFSVVKGQFATILTDITERMQADERLTRQLARLHTLHKIEQAVTSSVDLNVTLELLVQEIVEQLQVDAAAVLLLNPHTQSLDFAAKRGFSTQALQFTNLPIGKGLAGQAAQERRIVHTTNLSEIPALSEAIADEKFVTYYGIPLIANDTLHGVIEIFHRSPLSPDPGWLTFLETLANQAAISIDNARLLEMMRQNLKEANAINRINRDLLLSVEPFQLMQRVVDLLKENFNYYHVQVYVADSESGDFIVRAASGEIGRQILAQNYRLAAGQGIVGFSAKSGQPFLTNDVENQSFFIRSPFLPDTKSELAVPIQVDHQFLGLIDVQQAPPLVLTERDKLLVVSVGDQLALALQKANLYRDLQDSLRQEQETRSQLIHNEKLTVAGRLLASVSHELNNPIQAIQNALFLLKEEDGISPQGKQDLEIVLSETERMAAMLQRLRASYRPVSPDDFKPVRLNDVIKDVCALVGGHLRHNQVSFEFRADQSLPAVPGVEDQLRQVVLNLFMNAVDAMPDGGHLTIATRHVVESGQALITVCDNGPGIEDSISSNIFDAFVTNKDGGTGLGLTISHEIIQRHRGRIQAENNPNQGATFSIWLPTDGGRKE